MSSVAAARLPAAMASVLVAASAAWAQPGPPATSTVTATIRDFKQWNQAGGHPDFERNSDLDVDGLTGQGVLPILGADGRPVYNGPQNGQAGRYVDNDWENAAGKPMCWCQWNAVYDGDQGSWDDPSEVFTTGANFNQWYRDILGVNLSTSIQLTLVRNAAGIYVFEDNSYFPIDNQLFLNSPANPSHNFHFTTQIHALFTYDVDVPAPAPAPQMLKFRGDDDVWVFIDGKLVIELAGTHGPKEQYVDLRRLGLVDGQSYPMDLFHAERQTDGSHFRFESPVYLQDAGPPMVTNPVD